VDKKNKLFLTFFSHKPYISSYLETKEDFGKPGLTRISLCIAGHLCVCAKPGLTRKENPDLLFIAFFFFFFFLRKWVWLLLTQESLLV
jgi:hypothetical protein